LERLFAGTLIEIVALFVVEAEEVFAGGPNAHFQAEILSNRCPTRWRGTPQKVCAWGANPSEVKKPSPYSTICFLSASS
jgi:hypothetical protein